MIKKEIDLRKRIPYKNMRYIEPNTGSTLGLPDGFSVWPNAQVLWFELKLAKFIGGKLVVKFTDAQKIELPKMLAEGALIVLIVGVVNTDDVFASSMPDALKMGLHRGEDVFPWIRQCAVVVAKCNSDFASIVIQRRA